MIDYGDQLIAADARIERVTGFGVDEHTFQHACATRRTQMVTTFVDIDRGRLLDVVPGRSGKVVRESERSHAYHSTGGASNGPTEAVNLIIEEIRRIGHGYRNFDN